MKKMKIVYLKNTRGFSGDHIQGNLLAKTFNAQIMTEQVLQGKAGVVEIDGMLYPKRNFVSALEEVEPDLVFIHTITPQLVNEIPKIIQRYVTVMRLAINYEEICVQPGSGNLIASLWNILSGMDCIICPSEFVLRNLRSLGYENTVHIPTAVDTKAFGVASGKDNNVLSVGRLGVVKNLATILLAFSKVRDEVPDARMMVVGDGPLRQVFQQMVARLNLNSWIRFVGAQPSQQFYSQAKLYVQSSFSENGSLTVLEALSAGLPCVLSDIGGHHYDTKAIQFAKHDDFSTFAFLMINLLTDDVYWGELHGRALEDVKKYDIDVVGKQYENLFEKLMSVKKFKR